jgi:hypothetical protein
LQELFSPDGYYAEGPYYQRYALSPFLLLAQSIQRHDPSRKILDYRDGVLRKAVYANDPAELCRPAVPDQRRHQGQGPRHPGTGPRRGAHLCRDEGSGACCRSPSSKARSC